MPTLHSLTGNPLHLTVGSVLDILLVAFVIYHFLLLVRGTRAVPMLTGVGVLVVAFYVAHLSTLRTLDWLVGTDQTNPPETAVAQLEEEKAFLKQGFSVVEVIAHCHTQYGKLNRLGGPVEMLQWQRDHAATVESAATMKPEEMEDKFLIGVLADRELPVYTEQYDQIRQRAKLEQGKEA